MKRRTVLAGLGASALLVTPYVAAARALPRNVRMVIGSSSTGGDTYQATAIVADALSDHLGINIKVDAVGVSEAFKALDRDKRGNTLMTFHDHAYLGYLYGVTGYKDPFEDYIIGPTLSSNPGNAYLVAKSSPYQNMADIFAAAASGEKIRVAIQPGGVSEIGFTAIKNAARVMSPGSEENIVAVNTGSQSDKNQSMWDSLSDVINGSIQANEQFTQLPADDQKSMRFVWITARPETLQQAPEAGMGDTTRDQLLDYASPKTNVTLDGQQDFTFDKEFFMLYNKAISPDTVAEIDTALAAIYAKGEIQKRQLEAFFIPGLRSSADSLAHLSAKRDTYRKVIDTISSGA